MKLANLIHIKLNRVRQLTPNDSGSDVTLSFPEGKSLYQVDWLGVISRKKKALYSRVLVDQVKERVPRPHTLSQVLKGKNGLSSTEVVILDSRTVMVKDLKFKGVAPGRYLIEHTYSGFFQHFFGKDKQVYLSENLS